MSKFTFKSALVLSSLLIFPLSVFAFHSVSEILPEGKILVCKDFNQIINGNKVEVYKLDQTKNRGARLGIQMEEFEFPQNGAKVKLYHRDFHYNGKKLSKYDDQNLGTGTVINYDLSGKEISKITSLDKNNSFPKMKKVLITEDEAEKYHKNCIVIQPDDQLNTNEITSVEF